VTPGTDGAWTLRVIYTFENSPTEGYSPHYLTSGPGGVLYRTTDHGPTTCYFCGTIFSLTPPADPDGAWTEQLLYTFETLSEPPDALQVIGSNGTLLGALIGDQEGGVVFLLDPPAKPGGAWSERVMHGFTGGTDGGNPMSAIVSGGGDLRHHLWSLPRNPQRHGFSDCSLTACAKPVTGHTTTSPDRW